jgi:hypothetical protein
MGWQPFETEEPKEPDLHYFPVFKEPLTFVSILYLYLLMELDSRILTPKEPNVAREPQVADPWL